MPRMKPLHGATVRAAWRTFSRIESGIPIYTTQKIHEALEAQTVTHGALGLGQIDVVHGWGCQRGDDVHAHVAQVRPYAHHAPVVEEGRSAT